jgi:hypothetical protein
MIIPTGIEGTNWELGWTNSLLIDYPVDNIPILLSKDKWRSWGGQLIQSDSFAENNAPGPTTDKDFKSYAERLFYVMSNTN